MSGFGLERPGALGSSVAHDSHNVLLAGTNARDLLTCARALAETGGGFVVAAGGEVKARLPLLGAANVPAPVRFHDLEGDWAAQGEVLGVEDITHVAVGEVSGQTPWTFSRLTCRPLLDKPELPPARQQP